MWPTGVTDIVEGRILVRGRPIEDLVTERSFSEVLVLLVTGRIPTAEEARITDAVLVASIDHGATSPSALTARTVASGGAPVQVAAAAGLLALSKYHGATVAECATLLSAVAGDVNETTSVEESARSHVEALLDAGERVPGFGHRVHKSDPRVERLFALHAELGMSDEYVRAAYAVGDAIEMSLGRRLPANLDTAIAAVLLPFVPEQLVLLVFMASRFCGVFMQAAEEIDRMRPMRRIIPGDWVYDGPRGTDG